MSIQNKSIYVSSNNELFVHNVDTPYEPGDNQAVLKVEYSGVNPADLKHGLHFGLNNRVAGYEFSGTVIKAGSGFPYAIGDVVYGSNRIGLGSPFGAHQDQMLIEGTTLIAKIPPTLPPAHAAVFSIVVRTAADALFNLLEIPFPAINSPGTPRGGGIVIWGGASAVGLSAIQLAKAAGLDPIITTASAQNHTALKELGATHCFDYRDEKVVDNINAALKATGQPLYHVFDTVVTQGAHSSTKECEAISTSPGAQFICVIPVPGNPKWTWCLASRGWTVPLPPPLKPVPAQPDWEARLKNVVLWAADNYNSLFRIPNVRVVEGTDAAIEAINLSCDGKISFEKIAIKHPL